MKLSNLRYAMNQLNALGWLILVLLIGSVERRCAERVRDSRDRRVRDLVYRIFVEGTV